MTATRKLTPAEEAAIQQQIASDPDAPEATDAQLATARPFAEALPELAASIERARGGRPKAETPKQQVTVRLDADVIERLKEGGAGWQSRLNSTLRKGLGL